jgi:hypothetical protein
MALTALINNDAVVRKAAEPIESGQRNIDGGRS